MAGSILDYLGIPHPIEGGGEPVCALDRRLEVASSEVPVLRTAGDRDLVAASATSVNAHRRPGAHADLDTALPGSTYGDGCADLIDDPGGFCARDHVKDLKLVGHACIVSREHAVAAAALGQCAGTRRWAAPAAGRLTSCRAANGIIDAVAVLLADACGAADAAPDLGQSGL